MLMYFSGACWKMKVTPLKKKMVDLTDMIIDHIIYILLNP